MLDNEEWIIIDTETTGLKNPVFPVEIAAQRMRGWEPCCDSFRVLLNFDVKIERDAERLHGYTRDFLNEHGMAPVKAVESFLSYSGKDPVVSYNMDYDLRQVLRPTFERMGIGRSITPGFCALRLMRALAPCLPNYRLETILRAFGLCECQKHRALEDVEAVIGLLCGVIRPHLERHDIRGMDAIKRCAKGKIEVPQLKVRGAV